MTSDLLCPQCGRVLTPNALEDLCVIVQLDKTGYAKLDGVTRVALRAATAGAEVETITR